MNPFEYLMKTIGIADNDDNQMMQMQTKQTLMATVLVMLDDTTASG